MTRDYFARLYAYTFWADEQLWQSIMQLSEEDYTRDLGYSRGSIRDIWVHTVATVHIYIALVSGGAVERLNEAEFADRAALRQQWEANKAAAERCIAALTPEDLAREITWPNRPMIYAWEALTQAALHTMDHRAQILAGLHELGAPTFEQDFIYHAIGTRA